MNIVEILCRNDGCSKVRIGRVFNQKYGTSEFKAKSSRRPGDDFWNRLLAR